MSTVLPYFVEVPPSSEEEKREIRELMKNPKYVKHLENIGLIRKGMEKFYEIKGKEL
jgi:hypothetical protein